MEVSEMSSASSGCEDSGDKNPPANSEKTETGASGNATSSVSWLFDDPEPSPYVKSNIRPDLSEDWEDDDDDEEYNPYEDYDDYDDYDDYEDYDDYDGYGFDELEDFMLMGGAPSGLFPLVFNTVEPPKAPEANAQYYDENGVLLSEDCIRVMKRSSKILEKLSSDQQKGLYCNVIFDIEDTHFPAHRSVLMAISSYFDAMFSGQFNESAEEIIKIGDVSSEEFKFILDFAYGRDLKWSVENILAVFMIAEMFCMDDLIADCKKQLKRFWNQDICEMEPEKFVAETSKLLHIAECMRVTELEKVIISDVKKHLGSKKNTEEILLIMTPNILFPLLNVCSSTWNPTKESEKLGFLNLWFQKNPNERLGFLKDLLPLLKLDIVTSDTLSAFESNLCQLFDSNCKIEDKEHFIEHLSKIKEVTLSNRASCNVELCIFYQNPFSWEGDLRVYRENANGDGSWSSKQFSLMNEIIESVQVNQQLVLLSEASFVIINLQDLSKPVLNRSAGALRRFSGRFVACCQKAQIIIAGRSKFKKSYSMSITVNAFHYGKKKPSLIPLFYFPSDTFPIYGFPKSLFVTPETFFVLACSDPISSSSSGVLHVKKDKVVKSYPFVGVSPFFLKGKYKHKRALLSYEESKMFVLDQADSILSGVSVTIDNKSHDESARCKKKILEEIADKDNEGIGAVKGKLLAYCKTNQGHIMLIAQEKHLGLFHMESLEKFKLLKFLPKPPGEKDAIDFDFSNTNFMLSLPLSNI